ncbi:MAG: XkdX family protein [Oscillospiraceae bacterium]|nr:XkdX family protein [Oscillospiraceae bacterium]
MFEKIRKWYRQGLWTAQMVRQAAAKGLIGSAQAEAILNGEVYAA